MATLSLLSPQILCRPHNFISVSAHRTNFINFHSRKTTKIFLRSRSSFAEEEEEDDEADSSNSNSKFEGAIELFNNREYYACHDVVENLWYSSSDPTRTLLHALLQCAVGFHHLFNQGSSVSILTVNTSGVEIVKNHKGAMMELGEAVCKLRKLDLIGGPFHQFEREISDVLEFIYQTQLELAACNEDLCIAMEQTEIAYKLLGSFAAKEKIYNIEINDDDGNCYIVFHPARSYGGSNPPRRTRLPKLQANGEHLNALSM